MKSFFLSTLFIISSLLAFPQEIQYFDTHWEETNERNAAYFRIVRDTVDNLKVVEDYYYLSKELQMKGIYRSFEPQIRHGEFNWWYRRGVKKRNSTYEEGLLQGELKAWYPDGVLQRSENYVNDTLHGVSYTYHRDGAAESEIEYKTGKIKAEKRWFPDGQLHYEYQRNDQLQLQGEVVSYYHNGQLLRQDKYENGKLISGKCYDKEGNEIAHFPFMQPPRFSDDEVAWPAYLKEHLEYPRKARRKNITGEVVVQFTVEKDGSIADISIVHSDNEMFNEPALELLHNSPKWLPAQRDFTKYEKEITLSLPFPPE